MADGAAAAAEPLLRAARDEDSEGVIALIARCYAEYPPNVLDVDGEEPELRAPASRFERFWVVEHEGAIVGSVAAATRGDAVMELKKLYVDRSLRSRGWGRRLVETVEDYARGRRCLAVELWSDTRFDLAHRVYEALGYVRTGRTRELHDLSQTTEAHWRKELRAPSRG